MRQMLRLQKWFRRFAVLAVLVLCAVPLWADALRCSMCGKTISGRYYRSSDGRIYCIADYNKSRPRCHTCGNVIDGTYYQGEGGTKTCKSCYAKSRPVCKLCHKKLFGSYYYDKSGNTYCSKCHEATLPVCCCCRKKISGIVYNFYGGVRACQTCNFDKRNPRCVECNGPVNKTHSPPLPYFGGYVCEKHRPVAVTEKGQINALLQSARQSMVNALGREMEIRGSRLEVKLSNLSQLMAESGQQSAHLRGFCRTRTLGPLRSHTIFALAGVSREHMLCVLAHELGHAWQNENNRFVSSLPSRFKEGFAEWVSYKVAKFNGLDGEAQRIIDNQAGDDYSQGVRDFLNYEKMHGTKATLELATKNAVL
ncbi:hypothetical protein IJT17_04975 [bacterium]|nr:hypothetical protein [bacterium]